MPDRRRAHREIESLEELDRLHAAGARSMRHWRLQSLDLRDRGEALRRLDANGAVLLGCLLDNETEERLRRGGALVFPRVPDVPVDPYRATLYSPEELYAGLKRLKPMDRATLMAFYIHGRSLKQMSREFETPVGTIKRRLHVARNRLRAALERGRPQGPPRRELAGV